MPTAHVFRKSMAGPNDVSAIEELIETGIVNPEDIIAILGKTEGNGCVNDFTRGYALQSLHQLFKRYLAHEKIEKICMTLSGGTEGGLSPHWLIFTRSETEKATIVTGKALAIGRSMTGPIKPTDLGRMGQVNAVAERVKTAMADANITNPEDVHFVQIKCPLLTSAQISGDENLATTDTLKSMGLSRGASALGVGVALNEISINNISDDLIGKAFEYYSNRASCSAGVELDNCEILVIGMSDKWSGELVIDHGVMSDAIDVNVLHDILKPVRKNPQFQLSLEEQENVIAVLAKAEASTSGAIRDQRHTMLNDSDISSTRHARGFTGGAISAVVGHTALFVSGGAEHQGPDGGGPIAAIYRRI